MGVCWFLLLLACKQYLAVHHDGESRHWSMDAAVVPADEMVKMDGSANIDDDDLTAFNNQLFSSEEQLLGTHSPRLLDNLNGKFIHLSDNEHPRDNGFIRFGRNEGALTKTGFIRFGRSGPGMVRLTRNDPELIRFGRRGDQFIRLGRNSGYDPKSKTYLSSSGHKKTNEHLASLANNPNSDQFDSRANSYIRFGRRDDGFVRLGKKSSFD